MRDPSCGVSAGSLKTQSSLQGLTFVAPDPLPIFKRGSPVQIFPFVTPHRRFFSAPPVQKKRVPSFRPCWVPTFSYLSVLQFPSPASTRVLTILLAFFQTCVFLFYGFFSSMPLFHPLAFKSVLECSFPIRSFCAPIIYDDPFYLPLPLKDLNLPPQFVCVNSRGNWVDTCFVVYQFLNLPSL